MPPKTRVTSWWVHVTRKDLLDPYVAYAVAVAVLVVSVALAANARRGRLSCEAERSLDRYMRRRDRDTLTKCEVREAHLNATLHECEGRLRVAKAAPDCPKTTTAKTNTAPPSIDDALLAAAFPSPLSGDAADVARAYEALRILLCARMGRPREALRLPAGATKAADVRKARKAAMMVVHPDKATGAPAWVIELCKEAAQVVNAVVV